MKTIRIRIAVAVSENEWSARGSSLKTNYRSRLDADASLRMVGVNHHIVWVEADVPLPEPPEDIVVKGEVNKVTNKHLELAQEALTHSDLLEGTTIVKDVAQALADAEQQEREAVLEAITTMQYPTNRGELDLVREHLVVLLNPSIIVAVRNDVK